MAMASGRSNTGCYTCKLRKKKCDEVRPACGPCTFRQITCHGYGEKPQFFYSAEDQKAEIEKIQRAVNESLKARRTFRISKKAGRLSKSRTEGPAGKGTQNDSTLGLSEAYEAQMILNVDPPRLESEADIKSAVFPIREPWPTTSTTPLQPSLSPVPSGLKDASNEQLGIIRKGEGEMTYPFTFLPTAPPAENAHDLTLIMTYLDHIFPLQFYFYQPSVSERGRGWLLGLILRSKSAYYSTLAFSVLQQLIASYNSNDGMDQQISQELDKYHSLAIAELQRQLEYLPTLSGSEHLKLGIEILACAMQLMSIEVFRETTSFKGWKGDWEFHLDAAGTLLSVIGAGLALSSDSSTSPDSNDGNIASDGNSPSQAGGSISEIAGLDFFMTVYVWSDIFRCASIGLNPLGGHPFPYLSYLEEERIRLDRVMGCKNWAMISIRETTDLEAWKLDMQRRGSLDMPMLYRRAAPIENRLTSGLDKLEGQVDELSLYDQESRLITELYALSALVYLAVIISGNSHHLPQVRNGVAKVFAALKSLPPHLLIRISWAYCVAGCMANETQKDDFRQLLYDAEASGYHLGTLWNGLEIMEEFWNLRESEDQSRANGTSACPWQIAMERMGTKILLI